MGTPLDPAGSNLIEHGETWAYTFGERAPDFVLTIRGETIARVRNCTILAGGPRWVWSIPCAIPWQDVGKPAVPLNGEAESKAEAIEGLRSA